MHATSVYIACKQFIRHQPIVCTQARSEDFCTRVVHVLLHTRVFVKFKSSCTIANGLSLHFKNDDIAEHIMKDWSCERLVLVVNAFSLTVARIVGPHLGWLVDEDAVIKLTEVQVALCTKQL